MNRRNLLHKLNRFIACVVVLSGVVLYMGISSCEAIGDGKVPEISAKHAVLFEAVTGRTIYEKSADEKAYPASLTKMLTCIIALENGSLDKVYTVSPRAAGTEDPYLGLAAGEQLTLRDLLLGLMMVSDNSSAVAIAEGLDGSVESFSKVMNDKAKAIGLRNSHFVTPNGLPADDHYSTARDMALIAAYGWKNSTFRDLVSQKNQLIRWSLPSGKTMMLENSNKLLGRMDGANGIKTGWTNAAGGCLAAGAQRGGVQLIAVVLDSENVDTRFDDAEKLLEYGFTQVERVKGIDKSRSEKKILVAGGETYKLLAHPAEDVYFPLLNGDTLKDYTMKYDTPFTVVAPVKKGQKVGSITIYYKGEELQQIPLLADDAVEKGNDPLSILLKLMSAIVNSIRG